MSGETPEWLRRAAKSRKFKLAFAVLVLLIVVRDIYVVVRLRQAQQSVFFDSTYQNVLAVALIVVMLLGMFVTGKKTRR